MARVGQQLAAAARRLFCLHTPGGDRDDEATRSSHNHKRDPVTHANADSSQTTTTAATTLLPSSSAPANHTTTPSTTITTTATSTAHAAAQSDPIQHQPHRSVTTAAGQSVDNDTMADYRDDDDHNKENAPPGASSSARRAPRGVADITPVLGELSLGKQGDDKLAPKVTRPLDNDPEAVRVREQNQFFINEALEMARLALRTNETPVGCVLVHEGKIIAKGMNATNVTRNGTRHAELMAISSLLSTPSPTGPKTTSLKPWIPPKPEEAEKDKKPAADGEAKVETKEPVDTAKAPVDIAKTPIDTAKPPVNTGKTPIDTANASADVDTENDANNADAPPDDAGGKKAPSVSSEQRRPDEGNEDGSKGHLYPYGQRFVGFERVDPKIISECVLYVTVEPCVMCASLLRQFGIKKVYFGAVNDKFGGTGGVFSIHANSLPVSEDGQTASAHPLPREPQSQLPDSSDTLGMSYPPGGGDGGNVEPGFEIEGGWGRDEAVGLLRRFYVQENGRGE
ncbi:tRNA(adenine34) deaminase, variant 2 [Purpureocillium takamizusanense]|uniref:tRNA(Adenine34) deaminase, variant 2 n=1 Tax=Purpureocillium takamizusanense TaxID=2060973 RepID=A0A9Q8VE48_9HYPO|nr:tRNA(adenine34) deaminase, variant 2 [Purpureocillium takamizusanense]UNI22293.1 tRNA(adenine34) deaminase, variant 2 [Purpureocillium takamizusanense]